MPCCYFVWAIFMKPLVKMPLRLPKFWILSLLNVGQVVKLKRSWRGLRLSFEDSLDADCAEGSPTAKLQVSRAGKAEPVTKEAALARFLDHVQRHERVWVPTRLDIARHWMANHRGMRPKSTMYSWMNVWNVYMNQNPE